VIDVRDAGRPTMSARLTTEELPAYAVAPEPFWELSLARPGRRGARLPARALRRQAGLTVRAHCTDSAEDRGTRGLVRVLPAPAYDPWRGAGRVSTARRHGR